MRPAATGLRAAISTTRIEAPAVPVVANASAQAMTTGHDVCHELEVQVASAVRWHESVTLMAAHGVQTFTEFGPGRVLTGLVKRIVSGADLVNIATLGDVAAHS
jgi:[acyl-carrier-protein] S-malonyltransferase